MGVDKYRYDEAWELALSSFVEKLYPTALDVLTELKNSLKSPVKVSVTELGKARPNHKPKPVTAVPQLDENTTLLDFRSTPAFEGKHLPGAINIPLSTLPENQPSPFEDSAILERQWREIDTLFTKRETTMNGKSPKPTETNGTVAGEPKRSSWVNWVPGFGASSNHVVDQHQRDAVIEGIFSNSKSHRVVCVDYGGDTARVATSVLRAKGVEAWSLRGGMRKWDEESDKAKTAA